MITIKSCSRYMMLVLLTCILFACKKEFLEITPKDQLSAESIFKDESGGDLFMNDIYNGLPDADAGSYNYDPLENYGDNSVSGFQWAMSWQLSIARNYGASSLNPGLYNHDYPAMPFMYNHMYVRIRKCNLFIQQVEKNAANYPEDWQKRRIAEARFLRAYYYHLAWMAYGGVPIITEPLNRTTQGEDIFQPRSTAAETYQFLVDELAAAATDLPSELGGGRATKGAALTLKGWVELFAGKYEAAAATNEKIIDEMGNGNPYRLFADYNAQFLAENNNKEEAIFSYQHVLPLRASSKSTYFGPKGEYGGWGQMQPTQGLVDAYAMANGLAITDQGSGYNEAKPYENREPRFYQSILYHGATFAGKKFDMKKGGEFALNPGAENNTGYFRRKGIDERLKGQTNLDGANYVFFRYAEVLLNFAEASIEQGQTGQKVINAINQVRQRSGLPTIADTYHRTLNQQELKALVRRERRVELAFENKRYWDLIRWRTAETVLNQPVYGVEITEQGGVLNYNTKVLVHTKQFAARNYLFPIFQGWIDANPAIKAQNGGPDGWSNGQNPGY